MSENATRCVPRSSGDGYGWPYPGLGPIGARPRVQGYGPGEAEAGPCTHGSDRYPTRTALHLPHLQEEPSRARQDTAAACTSCRTDFSWYTLTNADLNRILDGVSSAASRLTAPLGLSRGCSDHGHGPRGHPQSGLRVQLCCDVHRSNFGVFAAPDRRLAWDVNDFDETLPGRGSGTSSALPQPVRSRVATAVSRQSTLAPQSSALPAHNARVRRAARRREPTRRRHARGRRHPDRG
jgi:Uncharacterized protein conserved in bacteria (DUF2252)